MLRTDNNDKGQMLCGNIRIAEAWHHLGSKAGSIHAREEGRFGAFVIAVRQRGRAAEQAGCRYDLLHVCCRHAHLQFMGAAIRGDPFFTTGIIAEVLLLQSVLAEQTNPSIWAVCTLTCRLRHSLCQGQLPG